MKIRVRDRLICALAGLILMGGAVALVLEGFFGFTIIERVHHYVLNRDLLHVVLTIVAVVVLLLIGAYCFCILFRRNRLSKNFVIQKAEGGELAISVKALEGLVQRCIDRHDELHVSNINLSQSRDGLIVSLKISLATGVNIPLTVSNLQKQIKQYVTSCSGVDVKEVRVQVETTGGKAVKEPPMVVEPEIRAEAPAEVHAPAAESEPVPEKKRPLHQRLFGRQEEPVTVPEAPAPAPEPETAISPESAPEAVDSTEFEPIPEAEALAGAAREIELKFPSAGEVPESSPEVKTDGE